MCLATSNNLLLVQQDVPKRIFFYELVIFSSAKKRHKDTFFLHPPSPFSSNFCNCGSICIASQFQVQLPLLYTMRSNAYSEISPEVTLRPLATSCVKDYKGHSLVQTSFTEPPNKCTRHYFLIQLTIAKCACAIADWTDIQSKQNKLHVLSKHNQKQHVQLKYLYPKAACLVKT